MTMNSLSIITRRKSITMIVPYFIISVAIYLCCVMIGKQRIVPVKELICDAYYFFTHCTHLNRLWATSSIMNDSLFRYNNFANNLQYEP